MLREILILGQINIYCSIINYYQYYASFSPSVVNMSCGRSQLAQTLFLRYMLTGLCVSCTEVVPIITWTPCLRGHMNPMGRLYEQRCEHNINKGAMELELSTLDVASDMSIGT